jgi:hypothetical protein
VVVIEVSDTARAVLGRSYTSDVRVQSWLGGELLAEDVPIAGATEEGDRSLAVPTRLSLTVPQRRRGYDWTPTTDDHPLAANGQQLHVQLGIGIGPDGTEWIDRGTFVILESQPDGRGGISVEAAELLYLVAEAGYASPYQPTGTLKSALRGLVEPALTVDFDSALVDRAVPADVSYTGKRIDAVKELLDAWPAEAVGTADGYLLVSAPATPDSADLFISDGFDGTIVRVVGNSTRDGAYNVVVAKGRTTDGADIQAAAYVFDGPRAYAGDFNPLAVTYEYFSPLLTTVAQCAAAARTVLARISRTSGREKEVEMVPDPTIQLGDCLSESGEFWTVERLSLPYKPGSMTLRIRSVL